MSISTCVHQHTCPWAHVCQHTHPPAHASAAPAPASTRVCSTRALQHTCSGHPWPPVLAPRRYKLPVSAYTPGWVFLLLLGSSLLIDSLSMNLVEENCLRERGDLIKKSQTMQLICSFCLAFETRMTIALGTEEASSSNSASGIELKTPFLKGISRQSSG